jgi:hypothetical protein
MNFVNVSTRAIAHVKGVFCLFFACMIACVPLGARHGDWRHQTMASCASRVTIDLFPDWVAAYPQCNLAATANGMGVPPVVRVQGCVPSVGVARIAKITVTYPECQVTEVYLAQTVDGVVVVDIIDLL